MTYAKKLKSFIKETPKLTQRQIAHVLDIDDQALYKKLNHAKKGFSIEEAIIIRDHLKSRGLYLDQINLNKIKITRVVN